MMTFEERIANRIEHVRYNRKVAIERVRSDLQDRTWQFLRAVRPDLENLKRVEAWETAEHEPQWGDGYLVEMLRDTDVRWNDHPARDWPKITMASGQYWRVGQKLRNALINNYYARDAGDDGSYTGSAWFVH